jgi:hypothetical protein
MQNKKRILKATREKHQVPYKSWGYGSGGRTHEHETLSSKPSDTKNKAKQKKLRINFSTEMLKAQRA